MREPSDTSMEPLHNDQASRFRRDIEPIGTAARLVVGLLLGSLIL